MMVQQSKIKTTEIIDKSLFSTVFCALELTKCEFGGGLYQYIPILGQSGGYLTSRFFWYKCVTIRAE